MHSRLGPKYPNGHISGTARPITKIFNLYLNLRGRTNRGGHSNQGSTVYGKVEKNPKSLLY